MAVVAKLFCSGQAECGIGSFEHRNDDDCHTLSAFIGSIQFFINEREI